MSDRYQTEGFYVSTLSEDLTATGTTINLGAVPARITKGYIVIEPTSATKREVIHFTSVGATTVTTTDDPTDASDATGRGCLGSITQGGVTAHDSGVTVLIAAVEQQWARTYSSFVNDHAIDGSHKTLTDSNGNEWLEVGVTADAINNLKSTNAAIGNDPILGAVGDDDNIGMKLTPKGTGKVIVTANDFVIPTNANIQENGVDPNMIITLVSGFLKPTTTAGCAASATTELATNDIDIDSIDFDKDTDENAYCNVAMPDNYDGGVIQFRFFWTTNTGGGSAETVVMELAGRAFASGDAGDQANGTAIEVSDIWEADKDFMISAWSDDVTLAGTPAAGELVHLELMRDTSEDDLAEDAKIMQIQIRYKTAKFSN